MSKRMAAERGATAKTQPQLARAALDEASEVRAGRFRADFYHQLGAYALRVAPLREREDDVALLAGHLLEQNRARLGLRGLRIDARAESALIAYDWPGTVRELEQLIARCALKALTGLASRPPISTLTQAPRSGPARPCARARA